MREILFKAKRLDNGEWVEGDLIHNHDGRVFAGEVVVDDYKGTACDKYEVGIGFCEVDPITICQFTGLTDKNGNRIWENDIVRFDSSSSYPIIWDSSYNAFGSCYYSDFDHLSKYRNTELEVIGNIFDNPELLLEGSNT